ncbi:MAG TPA: hypothetical protein VKY32_07620 [Flavobacterium sp.]|nr:hypothetical protein [Flavobacterium sp.]
MKKLILTLAVLLGTFSAQATTLFIENYCSQARARILHMMLVGPGGECHFDVSLNPNYFVIDPMDSFTITDGLMGNFQFPFLDVFPFSGNVYFSNPAMSLPLPPAGNEPPNAIVDRYQFMSMRFWLDNAGTEGMSADYNASGYYEDTGSYTGVFNSLPGNPPYTVDYVKVGSIYWFSFND